MCTYCIILILTLILTLIPTLNIPIYKFKYQSMIKNANQHLQISIYLIIVQTSIYLIMMQILYSYQTVPTCISILIKINILIDNSKYTNIKRNLHVKCMSLHLLLYCLNTTYWEGKKGKKEE